MEINEFVKLERKITRQLFDIVRGSKSMNTLYESFLRTPDAVFFNKLNNYIVELDYIRTTQSTNSKSFMELFVWLSRRGFSQFVSWNVIPDEKKGKGYVSYLASNGFTTSSKELYLKNTKEARAIRKKYFAFLRRLFECAFGKGHSYRVEDIFELEKEIAPFLYDYEKPMTFKKRFHFFSLSEFERTFGIDWTDILTVAGTGTGADKNPHTIVVENPAFLKHVFRLYQREWATERMKTFWVYQMLLFISAFDKPLHKIVHDFRYGSLVAEKSPQERSLWNVEIMKNTQLNLAYLRKHTAKKEIQYVSGIAQKFKEKLMERVRKAEWLSLATREKTILKVRTMKIVVGEKQSYVEDPEIDYLREDCLSNVEQYNTWLFKKNLEILHSKKCCVAREVTQNLFNVNAYYINDRNELFIPNAILQAPFIDLTKTDAYNYANMGTIIGHEMMHCLDNDSIEYDHLGAYKPSWKENEIRFYRERQNKIKAYYEEQAKRDGIPISADLTMDENLADIGGLLITEEIFLDDLKRRFAKDEKKELEEFYRFYTEKWRSIIKPKAMREMVHMDIHSISKYRVNCVLAMSPHFNKWILHDDGFEVLYPF
jgi:predicted metalloendopeptidase